MDETLKWGLQLAGEKEGMDVGTQGGHSEDIMPGISFFSRTAKGTQGRGVLSFPSCLQIGCF